MPLATVMDVQEAVIPADQKDAITQTKSTVTMELSVQSVQLDDMRTLSSFS